ncbi:MAG: ATP-binding protein [Eubacteriales bacterium]|nr:ATP-binding protein [Eubacteriales bacterium]
MDQEKEEVFFDIGKRKRKELLVRQAGIIAVLIIVISALLYLGRYIWTDYRDTLVENQKAQMLIISQTLGKNITDTMLDYKDDLELLAEMESGGTADRSFYERYLGTQERFEKDLMRIDAEGEPVWSIYGTTLQNQIFLTQMDAKNSIWQCEDPDGNRYLAFRQRFDNGDSFLLVIDGEAYYEKLISDIHVGTNGYIMIKNSSGIIVMHPERNQWGIDVIEGRKKLYPDLDYTSLEEMIRKQISGNSGLSDYYSYWWTQENPTRVRKISAYAPAWIDDDYWVVSAVIDYDDLYSPVAKGVQNLLLVFAVGSVVFILLAVYIGKLLFEQRKADSEIGYLRELNQVLEEMHRSEETIAHQQRLQIMGTMTGGIAHEFNNFLTPIMGHAELLMLQLPEDSEEYESAQEIYDASEKAKEIIRQISSMSRKNVETVYKNIDCLKFLTRAVKMVQSVCPANVTLKEELGKEEGYILGNPTQLNQVLLNICVNAIHAIGRDEGSLMIRTGYVDKKTVMQYVSSEPSDIWKKYLMIEIGDDGCGMDKETVKQIFEPFFTTKKTGEGTGLGLALAEQIITSHKGFISVQSELGKGSIFRIFLPATEAPEMQTRTESGRNLHFVIVDDNAKILQMLGKSLEKLKLSVASCRNGAALEECLKKQGADVLLIDESLEDGSGVDFCMALQGKYPEMLRIIMTDHVTREIVEAKQRKIIDAYIEKPVSRQTILETVYCCTHEEEQQP